MSEHMSSSEHPLTGWRIKLGIALFVLSIALPLVGVPVVTTLGTSSAMTGSISGVLLVGAEILGIAAIALMGKSGYAYIKRRVAGVLRQYGPPQKVGRTRYTVGLVMFCVSVVFGWLSPYIADLIPGFLANPLPYALGGDLLVLASVFVLGGDFWDKLRSVFVYDAEGRFPQVPADAIAK